MRTNQLSVFHWHDTNPCMLPAYFLLATDVPALPCLHCCKYALLQVAMHTNQLGVFYWDDTNPCMLPALPFVALTRLHCCKHTAPNTRCCRLRCAPTS
jgi:hypothetical protein